MAEVEQRKALEHPRRRGHLPGMWVEAIAHQSFLPMGRGETRSTVAFSDKVRAPATGGGPASGWRGERKLGSTVHVEKAARGVLGAPLTVEDFATAEAAGQRRWHARQGHDARTATCSASGMGGGAVGMARVRRGEAASAAWLRF
jgi:hypothetical protein